MSTHIGHGQRLQMLRVEVKFMEECVFCHLVSVQGGGYILCEDDPKMRQISSSQELHYSLFWLQSSVWEKRKSNWYSEVWGFQWISFMSVCSSLPSLLWKTRSGLVFLGTPDCFCKKCVCMCSLWIIFSITMPYICRWFLVSKDLFP